MAHPSRSQRFPIVAIVALLFLSVFISYVDRGNLSIAAPSLQEELGISATQLGVLLASFFWSYTLVLSVSGWLVDRFDVKWVLCVGYIIWSVATAITGLVEGFTLLLVCRLLLGVGESVTFPSYSKILARRVGQEHRGFANAMIACGMMAGPAVGTYVLGHTIGQYGWRPVFGVLGTASLLWVVPWIILMPADREARATSTQTVGSTAVFRQRSFWAAALGHFTANYQIYFMISWLPYYLVKQRGESMDQMAFEGAMFYVAFAVASPLTGLVSDRLIRAGCSVNRVRKTSVVLGHVVTAVGLYGLTASEPSIAFKSLLLMGAGGGICGANIFTFAQTLAGPAAAGKWVGYQNCLANLAGIVVAPLTGWIVDRTGDFRMAFLSSAVVSLLGAVAWGFGVGELKQVEWQPAGGAPAAGLEKAPA